MMNYMGTMLFISLLLKMYTLKMGVETILTKSVESSEPFTLPACNLGHSTVGQKQGGTTILFFCNGVGDWLNYNEKRRGMLLMIMMVPAEAICASISLSPHWLRDYQIFMNPQYVKEMNPYSQKFPILTLSPFYLSISLLYLYVAYPTKSCWMSVGDSHFIHVMNMPYSWL